MDIRTSGIRGTESRRHQGHGETASETPSHSGYFLAVHDCYCPVTLPEWHGLRIPFGRLASTAEPKPRSAWREAGAAFVINTLCAKALRDNTAGRGFSSFEQPGGLRPACFCARTLAGAPAAGIPPRIRTLQQPMPLGSSDRSSMYLSILARRSFGRRNGRMFLAQCRVCLACCTACRFPLPLKFRHRDRSRER